MVMVQHPHIKARKIKGAPTHEQAVGQSIGTGFNARLALRITGAVGTMQCAYAFTFIALVSLPAALISGSLIVIVGWIAQTFLQLVLLSIIIVGTNVSAAGADARAQSTFDDATATLHTALEIEKHLLEQDKQILAMAIALKGFLPQP